MSNEPQATVVLQEDYCWRESSDEVFSNDGFATREEALAEALASDLEPGATIEVARAVPRTLEHYVRKSWDSIQDAILDRACDDVGDACDSWNLFDMPKDTEGRKARGKVIDADLQAAIIAVLRKHGANEPNWFICVDITEHVVPDGGDEDEEPTTGGER